MDLSSQDLRSNTNNGNHRLLPKEMGECWYEEEQSPDNSGVKMYEASHMDREWRRRRNDFHTKGYRDGLIAGKEASAQVGFNVGFGESVYLGYNWGLVRGIASTLACLPEGLVDRLVEVEENRIKFQDLHESVSSISKEKALKVFHDYMVKKAAEESANTEYSCMDDLHDQSSKGVFLETTRELQRLILESPAIKLHLDTGNLKYST